MGSEPEWNETFVFNVSGDVSELSIRILDSDAGTADDFVGHAKYVASLRTCLLEYISADHIYSQKKNHYIWKLNWRVEAFFSV